MVRGVMTVRFGVPCIVLSHCEERTTCQGPTMFIFVTDGVKSAGRPSNNGGGRQGLSALIGRATYTSQSYAQSLESALQLAHLG